MEMFFLAEENVIHPETREVLVMEGGLYTAETMCNMAEEFGIDNVKGRAIIAKSVFNAFEIISRL